MSNNTSEIDNAQSSTSSNSQSDTQNAKISSENIVEDNNAQETSEKIVNEPTQEITIQKGSESQVQSTEKTFDKNSVQNTDESTENRTENTDENQDKDKEDADFVMPEIPEIDPDTGEILNQEKPEITEEAQEEVKEIEKTEEELKKEKKIATRLARKEKIKSFFLAILKHFARLKQKKYWIPLVVGHAIMFSCMGYYAYKEIQYAKSTDFVVESIEQALAENNLNGLLGILNISVTKDRLKKSIKKALENNPDFAKYIGELADNETLDAVFEKILINIVKGIDEDPPFNKKLFLLPPNLSSQIRKTPFVLNEQLSKPQNSIYIFEIMLDTVRFGKFPLQLKARYFKDKWSIVEISNIAQIVEQYDNEIKRIRIKADNFQAEEQAAANALILKNLPNLQCSASITTLSGQDILIIQVTTDKSTVQNSLVSWAAETQVFVDDTLVHEEYVKANGIFQGGTEFSHTTNIRLSEAQSETLKGHVLRCEATPELINLPDGVFYTYED